MRHDLENKNWSFVLFVARVRKYYSHKDSQEATRQYKKNSRWDEFFFYFLSRFFFKKQIN